MEHLKNTFWKIKCEGKIKLKLSAKKEINKIERLRKELKIMLISY